jgi:two-component system invasion response regulator UvrY
MRILITDDHAVFRRGLKEVLAEQFSGAVFGEAETAQSALEQVWKNRWDLMILDLSMPGRSGVEILKEVKLAQPKLPVLVLSVHPEEQYALRVLEAGAAGYITKISAIHELIHAVKKVAAGGTYVTPGVSKALVGQLRPGGECPSHTRLSNRELEILRMLTAGKSAKAIGNELSLSAQTISTHRARMLKKLRLHSTAELIRYAIQNSLME